MKTYVIGGKTFELKPLTLRQKQLAAPMQNKILSAIKKLAAVQLEKERAERENKLLQAQSTTLSMFDTSMEMLCLETEGDEFPKFLATILTPSGETWKQEHIEQYAEVMLEIDEITQQEVLHNFFFNRSGSNHTLPNSTPNLNSGKNS